MFAEGLDYLPVSSLAEIAYCPRNFYYRVIEQLDDLNVHTLRGTLQEQKRDARARVHRDEHTEIRSQLVSSDRLGLIAVVDAIRRGDNLLPIEYKSGQLKQSLNDDLQLCAEAMILEDALDLSIHHGFIYYTASRRRRKVQFSDHLRNQVRQYMQRAWNILHSGRVPDPVADERCDGCSLRAACLPEETLALEGSTKQPSAPGLPHTLGRSLIIDEQGAYLRKRKGRLRVLKRGDQIASVPALEIQQLVLVGAVQVSTQALRYLLDANVQIHYLSYYGRYQGCFVPEYHKNVQLRLNQTRAHMDPHTCLALSKAFARGKMTNMRIVLRRAATRRDIDSCTNAANAIKRLIRRARRADAIDELRGYEGNATREYFHAFSDLLRSSHPNFDFRRRDRRPPPDPVNALLGFAYTMLTSEMIAAVSVAGLDPYIGFYHTTKYGRPALALDLIEEFRPIVADAVVRRMVSTGMAKPGHFRQRAGGCFLNEHGREAFYRAWDNRKRQEATHPTFGYRLAYGRLFELQARILAKVVTGDLEDYVPFTVK